MTAPMSSAPRTSGASHSPRLVAAGADAPPQAEAAKAAVVLRSCSACPRVAAANARPPGSARGTTPGSAEAHAPGFAGPLMGPGSLAQVHSPRFTGPGSLAQVHWPRFTGQVHRPRFTARGMGPDHTDVTGARWTRRGAGARSLATRGVGGQSFGRG